MAFPPLSSWFKSKGPAEPKAIGVEKIECPRCGRFFQKRGHDHEPLCNDCWKLTKAERAV